MGLEGNVVGPGERILSLEESGILEAHIGVPVGATRLLSPALTPFV